MSCGVSSEKPCARSLNKQKVKHYTSLIQTFTQQTRSADTSDLLWLSRHADLIFCHPCRGQTLVIMKLFITNPKTTTQTTSINILQRQKRSGGDASDKALNHLPLYLFSPALVNSAAYQALLQTPHFFQKMQIINSLSCCLANRYAGIQWFSCVVSHATGL